MLVISGLDLKVIWEMSVQTKSFIKIILKKFGVGITSYANLQKLKRNKKVGADIEFLSKLSDEQIPFFLRNLKNSNSQLRQDLFVLSELKLKRGGFFVEFGATNGIHMSNTYLLEKKFGWNGILAEPAKCWHGDLNRNRTCHIETRCVWSDSDSVLVFNETDRAELSTIDTYSSKDLHAKTRKSGKTYEVMTISLLDLLEEYDAPKCVDYLSIDTEGSEFEILADFDFVKYEFKLITCEHNYTDGREKIHDLLTSKGYSRKFEDISLFDDWYVRDRK